VSPTAHSNEAERIAATLAALGSAFPEAAVWVADDGSSDATAEIARRAGAKVVRSEHAIGKGAAVTLAAREALAETRGPGGAPRVFLLCDGDLAESAAELARIVEVVRTGKADLAVATFATRIGGGLGLARGFARRAIRWRCGLATAAPISGQRALTEATLCEVLPFASGYGMEIGMTIDAVRAGRRLVEVELV